MQSRVKKRVSGEAGQRLQVILSGSWSFLVCANRVEPTLL